MKKHFIYLLLWFECIFCFTGCGREDTESGLQEQTAPPVDWKQEGFAVSGEVEEEQEFWVQEFIPWGHEEVIVDPGTEKLFSELLSGALTLDAGPRDGKIYRLNTVIRPPDANAVRWILEIYDTEAMQTTVREFTPEQLGQGEVDKDYFLVDMDLVDTEEYVFQWTELERNEEYKMHQTADRIIYSNLQDNPAATDLWDTCLEKGIFEDEYTDYLEIPSGNCVCDGAGNTYIRAGMTESGYYSRLAAFDREGNLLLDYQGSEEKIVEEPLRTETGELIYPIYDMKEKYYDFMWADVQTGKMKLLASFDSSERIRQMCGMQGNNVYYEVQEGIVRWDTASGKRTLVFHYQDNGIGIGYDTMLAFREGQPPLLRLYRTLYDQTREDWLASLSETMVVREDAVRIVALTDRGSGQVSECAALVSRRDLNKGFTYESAGQGQDAEDYRTKIFAELAAGKGPDILYVSRSDMKVLHEAGLLLDLREVIPEETLDDLLPGVIGLGTLDGKLEGMAGGVRTEGLAVSADVWGADTWRLEDFTALVEEGKLEGLMFYNDSYYASLATMLAFTRCALQDSFLIDWENRECHFEDERYIRFLEAVNIDLENLDADPETRLKGGKRAAYIELTRYGRITDRGYFESFVKEGGNFVGFPTEGDCGNYLDAPGVLVVNANTDKKEAVRTFLEYFLGEKIQSLNELNSYSYDTYLGVRKLSLDELEQDEEGRYFWRGEEVSVFEDGTTTLHKAKEFLESCVAAPIVDPVVYQILYEELDALYSDNTKDPGAVADIIDRRIQIYLDEE